MGLAYRFLSVWTVYDRYEAVLGPGGEADKLGAVDFIRGEFAIFD